MSILDEKTLEWLATDQTIDTESKVPYSAVVFMLYYGLELKTYLLKASDKFLQTFPAKPRDLGDTSVYLAGSCAQGFYMNTKQLQDARDFDIVTIFKNFVVENDSCSSETKDDNCFIIYQRTTPNISSARATFANEQNDENGDEAHGLKHKEAGKNIYTSSNTLSARVQSHLMIKRLPDTKPGYVLLKKCSNTGSPNILSSYVSSSELTQARKKYWQLLWEEKFEENDDLPFGAIWTTGPAVTIALRHEVYRQTLPVESDLVFALQYPGWPKVAEEWLHRKRLSGWPSEELIKQVRDAGCLIVPKGYFGSPYEEYEWRVSFSLGEVILSRSMSTIQRELLQICKALITEPQYSKDLWGLGDIPSYFMLHTLFWLREEIEPSQWKCCNLASLLFKFLDRLIKHLSEKYLPHYFVPSINLMEKYSGDMYTSSDGVEMRTDRKFTFILYGLMRIRKDPLGQLLQQRRFLRLPSELYEDIFKRLPDQIKTYKDFDRHLFSEILNEIAQFYLTEGDFITAQKYVEDAYKLKRLISSTAEVDDLTAKILHTLTKCYHYTDDVRKALIYSNLLNPFLQNVVKSRITVGLKMSRIVSESLQFRGKLLLADNRENGQETSTDITSEALQLFRDAAKLNKTLKNVLELTCIYLHMGKLNEIEELLSCLETGRPSSLFEDEEEILYERCSSLQGGNTKGQENPPSTQYEECDKVLYGRCTTPQSGNNKLQETVQFESISAPCDNKSQPNKSLNIIPEGQACLETTQLSNQFKEIDETLHQTLSTRQDGNNQVGEKIPSQSINSLCHKKDNQDDTIEYVFECFGTTESREPGMCTSSGDEIQHNLEEKHPDKFLNTEYEQATTAIFTEPERHESLLPKSVNHNDSEAEQLSCFDGKNSSGLDKENAQDMNLEDDSLEYLDMKLINLFTISVLLENLGYKEYSKSVITQLKDTVDEPDHYTAVRLKRLKKEFMCKRETHRISSGEPYLPINEDDYIVYTKSDIPFLDDVLKACFEQGRLDTLKLPLYLACFHMQIECKKAKNFGMDSLFLLIKLRQEVDNQLKISGNFTRTKFETDKVLDEYYESLQIVAEHLRALGDTKSAENIQLQASQGREIPSNVHDRAISFIEKLMDIVPKTEVENPSLAYILG